MGTGSSTGNPQNFTPEGALIVSSGAPSGGGSSTLTTTQNALSTTAEVILAANASRIFAEVKNADGAINIYLGDDNTVTAANGHLLRPGEAFTLEGYAGAVWAIAASGTPTITTVEW